MAGYRFRVKLDAAPTECWRDIVVGSDRTLVDVQRAVNESMGLDQAHLWFFGRDEDYWRSSVKYQSPAEADDDFATPRPDERLENAGTTTVADLELDVGDRICYVFDYGAEWRFYAILKEIDESVSNDEEAAVEAEKGEQVDQYAPPGEGTYR